MDPADYRDHLRHCHDEQRPVIQSVFVLGTTELGSVDPLPALLAVRDQARAKGLDSPVHVDAAYGGYFATLFRPGLATQPPEHCDEPWLEPLRQACAALPATESITVDPHKMGYAPYGAGAIVARHGFLRRLVAEGAPYALDSRGIEHEDLGKFILEGSKPGAAAAAVLFNHRMMSLDRDGYGRHLLDLCRLAHDFYGRVIDRDAGWRRGDPPFRILPLARPETNIVCLIVVPSAARGLAAVDRLNDRVAQRFGVREVDSVQTYDYLVSKTRLAVDAPVIAAHERLASLARDCDEVTCLRLVFMNRWVEGETAEGRHYLDDFLDTLGAHVRTLLTEPLGRLAAADAGGPLRAKAS